MTGTSEANAAELETATGSGELPAELPSVDRHIDSISAGQCSS